MAEEGKGVALAILGIVAVIAVVGLVLLFTGASGQGVYGGQMRQGESDIRLIGEEPGRYTSPVPADEGGTFYSGRKSTDRPNWEFARDPCPDDAYPVRRDIARMGGRECPASAVQSEVFCCPFDGSAGVGVYE